MDIFLGHFGQSTPKHNVMPIRTVGHFGSVLQTIPALGCSQWKRSNGNSVHLDFSECFESAQNRTLHPETVPFRMTRMMVSVLGIGGTEGVFLSTAKFTMNILSRNRFSLMALLDVFGTKYPVDTVKQKLNGVSADGSPLPTPDDQVQHLVKMATNEYNLCQMMITSSPQWWPHW